MFCQYFRSRIIDLPSKKMAKWKAAIIFILFSTTACGQDSGRIGADLAETARNGNLKIMISYGFAPHWSSEASSSFRIINSISQNPFFSEAGYSKWEISFRYWPTECYKGASIAIGTVFGFRLEPDMKVDTAYSIPIMKHISLEIGYGLRILETVRNGRPDSKDIRIAAYYRF